MPQRDRFLIAPYNQGLVNNVKPWLIPDDAFSSLRNAYNWRSRIRKRVGSEYLFATTVPTLHPQLLSRFRIQVDTLALGAAAGNVPAAVPLNVIGQMFSIGQQLFTINNLGSPVVMLNTGPGTGTYDTATGAYTFAGILQPDGTPIYFYPALPVMGFATLYTNVVNFERYIGFDTRFAYELSPAGGWFRLDGETTPGASVWSGNDFDFFYSLNYQGTSASDFLLFVTNNTVLDGLRYFDSAIDQWNYYTPAYLPGGDRNILTARLIFSFKGRLLLLNTVEEDGTPGSQVQFQQRCRYSALGNPLATDAFYEPPQFYGFGGFTDAPTKEAIISAQILRDRLIVYFEQSVWELVYTNNEISPFKWQNINIELGAESTHSLVSFDKGILCIGDVGIHTTNGINVQRIDDDIPNEVFKIENDNNGIDRVAGVRDYDAELVYWTYASVDYYNPSTLRYPNNLLVYNYKNGTWAKFDDSITAFGYVRLGGAETWGQLTYLTWGEWITPWGAGQNQSRQPRVMAGNQEGYTFYMDKDLTENAHALQITDIAIVSSTVNSTTLLIGIINHNLPVSSAIHFENINGSGTMTSINNQIAIVTQAVTSDVIEVTVVGVITGVYSGGGVVSRVSNIDIQTKQYNFYLSSGVNFSINKVDMHIDRQPRNMDDPVEIGPQIQVQFFPSSGDIESDSETLATGAYPVVYYPYEQNQDRIWHTLYPAVYGSFVQLYIYWTPEQLIDPNISLKDFVLHAMMFYTQITDSRLQ